MSVLRRSTAVFLRVLSFTMLGLGLVGCTPVLRDAPGKPGNLPASVDELVRYADEEAAKETAVAEENVIVAVDHRLTKDPRAFELLWRGARACAWLTEELADTQRRSSYAQKGVDYAKRAIEAAPKDSITWASTSDCRPPPRPSGATR